MLHARKLWGTLVTASKMCKSVASILDECKACVDTFPEILGSSGSINEPLKLALFCERRDEVDKVVAAMNCEEALAGLGGSTEQQQASIQALQSEVAAAKSVLNQYVDTVLQSAAAALRGSDVTQDQSVLAVLGRESVFKTMWMLARAAKADSWDILKAVMFSLCLGFHDLGDSFVASQ